MRLLTRLDRYPAKMVSKLADRLIDRFALGARRVLDPFCGSGAILAAARRRDIPVSGIDINPVAALLSSVKLNGFDASKADWLARTWIRKARKGDHILPVQWETKHYWFTPMTMNKFERLRFGGRELDLAGSAEGIATLLSYALAIRLCSRADPRSPKPFISKQAKESRSGKHFDPYRTIISLLEQLADLYGQRMENVNSQFYLADVVRNSYIAVRLGKHSHVVTSPPYINAQDYFRNFKLELYLLEGILPFRVEDIRERFVGTERGNLLQGITKEGLDANYRSVSCLRALERKNSRLAAVIHRYLHDMTRAFNVIKECLDPNGHLVIVCGDNLVGGFRISTWAALQRLLEDRGFRLYDRFADPIGDRLLAPKRCGHKGLIKEETVSAFCLR